MADEMTKPRCRGCRRILVESQDLFQWFGPPTQTPEDDGGWWHLRCHQDRYMETSAARNKYRCDYPNAPCTCGGAHGENM
jgi:hypothetical protein